MDFTFDEQQLEFRDAVRRFLVVEAAPENLREFWETNTGRSTEMRAKITEQGVTALSVPEAHGGLGLGDLDWVLILQEAGYHGIPDSLSDSAYLAVSILAALPQDHSLAAEWLPRMVAGRARIAVGHPLNPLTADAGNADLLLLWHNDELHATSKDQVTLSFNPSIDRSRRLYKVDWTPGDSTRVLEAEAGRAVWEDTVNRASLSVAAQLRGLARRMLDLGVDYAAQRKQFGKPIGSFQAIKHHMANVAVKIEFSGPLLHRAAYSMAHGDPQRPLHISQARLAASEAALLAARNSIQVHGAIGYTQEADLQMFMKRAWALDSSWGTQGYHKRRVADAIFAEGAELGPGTTFE